MMMFCFGRCVVMYVVWDDALAKAYGERMKCFPYCCTRAGLQTCSWHVKIEFARRYGSCGANETKTVLHRVGWCFETCWN